MNDGGTALVVVSLGDPHLLKGVEGGQDGAADPDRVLALGGRDDLDLDVGGRKGRDLLAQPVGHAGEHRRTSRQHDVLEQVPPDIAIALHDRVVRRLVDAASLHPQQFGIEQRLWASESLVAKRDHLSIRHLVALLEDGGARSLLHLSLEVLRNVAQLLLDVTGDLPFRGRGQVVAALGHEFAKVVCEVPARKIQSCDGMGQRVAFVDRHRVRHPVAAVQHNPCRAS
eukprot:3934809-Rhodomonas_salina.1